MMNLIVPIIRHHSDINGHGHFTVFGAIVLSFLVIWASYIFITLLDLSLGLKKTKKHFLLDLIIPFRSWVLIIIKEYKKLS